jgi:hypothetical protein
MKTCSHKWKVSTEIVTDWKIEEKIGERFGINAR